MMISRRSIPSVAAATTLVLGWCGGSDAAIVTTDVDFTGTVDSSGGVFEEGGVRVVIPASALSQSTTIHVETVDLARLPVPLPAGLRAASSVIRLSTNPSDSYFYPAVEVTIPYGGNGATILHLQYDSYDDEWEWEVLGWDGGNVAGGVATVRAESPGYFVVVHQVAARGVDVATLCDGLVSCRDPDDDEDDYTTAECEALLPVALAVYASYYDSSPTHPAGCGDALVDYYACLADNWSADPVCEDNGYTSFPEFAACEAAFQAVCPDTD